ncbi:hypothetical protein K040078D81_39860 [Blautia hominis]|uniref:DUF4178 domain-containing protein n=1 Tax=Blautia hominis TaxID=2025493 RepID=A0ABQ0BEM0_9FIRM
MTYREKLQMDYPGIVKKGEEIKECIGYYEFANGAECIQDCEKCWDREIPGTEDKEMTKADLVGGMICESREGNQYIWLDGKLNLIYVYYSEETGPDLRNEDGIKEHDIVKVYAKGGSDRKYLIWERKEPKAMTLEDIERELGYPVKIVSAEGKEA